MQQVSPKIAICLILWSSIFVAVSEGYNISVRHKRYDEILPSILKIKYHHQDKVNLVVLKIVLDTTLADSLIPMRYIDSQGELSEEHLPYQNPIVVPTFYQGVNRFAAVTYYPRTRTLHGVLDRRVYVDKLPLHVVDNPDVVDRFVRPIPDEHEHSSNTRNKRGLDRKRKLSGGAESATRKKFKGDKTKRVLYPEIYLIVDIPSEQIDPTLRNVYERAIMYVLSYWNAVDMLFRNLKSTEMKLNIAGILIGKKQDLEASGLVNAEHIKTHNQRIFILKDPALDSLGKYFYHSEIVKRDSFDFLIWMTSSTLVDADVWYEENNDLQTLRNDYVGIAEPADCGGMHYDEDHNEKTSNRAIVMYDHEYSQYHTAARVLAHLMFVSDDDIAVSHDRHHSNCLPPNPLIQSSGIMDPSNKRIGDYLLWSYCSEIHFERYSRSKSACCLFNFPSRTIDMPEPPYYSPIKSQCECYGMRPHNLNHYRRDICNKPLACKDRKGQNILVAMPLDGTPCVSSDVEEHSNNFCIHNDCV